MKSWWIFIVFFPLVLCAPIFRKSSDDPTALSGPSWPHLHNSRDVHTSPTFEEMSRRSFKSLVSSNYEDDRLEPPETDELPKEEKKRLRKERRRKTRKERRKNNGKIDEPLGQGSNGSLPDKRRAFVIATKNTIEKEMCQTMPMKQRVHMDGCLSKIVVNKFCYGQCNSFFIPKLSSKRLRHAFESCSVCQPTEYTPVVVTLQCPNRTPSTVKKRVMTIKKCSCTSMDVNNSDVL